MNTDNSVESRESNLNNLFTFFEHLREIRISLRLKKEENERDLTEVGTTFVNELNRIRHEMIGEIGRIQHKIRLDYPEYVPTFGTNKVYVLELVKLPNYKMKFALSPCIFGYKIPDYRSGLLIGTEMYGGIRLFNLSYNFMGEQKWRSPTYAISVPLSWIFDLENGWKKDFEKAFIEEEQNLLKERLMQSPRERELKQLIHLSTLEKWTA